MDRNHTIDKPPVQGTFLSAAEYVRMSTDHQQYSTQNQADKIREYAERVNPAMKLHVHPVASTQAN